MNNLLPKEPKMNKTLKIILGVIILAMLILLGIRLFSDEDTWICEHGTWVKHGNPSSPEPTTQCEQ